MMVRSFFFLVLLLFCCLVYSGDVVVSTLEEVDACERRTKAGDRVYVKYTGSIDESSKTGEPNTVFDSNMNKRTPLEFYIGGYFTFILLFFLLLS